MNRLKVLTGVPMILGTEKSAGTVDFPLRAVELYLLVIHFLLKIF